VDEATEGVGNDRRRALDKSNDRRGEEIRDSCLFGK
jgi:hypothetical protein